MLTWKDKKFYLNDEPFLIHGAGIHYFRSLPDRWKEYLQKIKDCGFNTVETYCAWNLHEEEPGQFDFTGRLDVEHFIELAAEVGLYVIVRPGPFICAEWEFGGLPAWLLKDENMRLRTDDGDYLKYVKRYFDELMPRLASKQETRGGNIIMFAAENEYGSFGNSTQYMNQCADLLKSYDIDVPIVTADGHTRMFLNGGHSDETLCCLDYGYSGSILEEHYTDFEELYPDAPYFHIEHWVGMFSHWNEPAQRYDARHVEKEIRQHLAHGDSFNLYMFHGGTNYGFMSGANRFQCDPDNPMKLKYLPDTTSYDYDALLTEWGEITPKYLAVQKAMAEYLGKELPKPAPVPVQNIGEVEMNESAMLFDQLDTIGGYHTSGVLHGMEYYGQNYGYILYRTQLTTSQRIDQLCFSGLADRVHIYFNGIYRGTVYRNDEHQWIAVDGWMNEGGTLDLLVDNMGRVGFGPDMLRGDRKGILDYVYISQNGGPRQMLCNWEVYTLPMKNVTDLSFTPSNASTTLPSFWRGTFKSNEQKDCFVHPEGFSKGFVVVNGFNLGSYWNVGPQLSLYLPGSLLNEENEIIVFDEEPVDTPSLSIKDYHILASKATDIGPATIV